MNDEIVIRGTGLDPLTKIFLRVEKTILNGFIELTPLVDYQLVKDIEDELFEITTNLETLFMVFGMSSKEYNSPLKIVDDIRILTPLNKWVKIEGLVRKTDKKIRMLFSNNNEILGGIKHLVRTDNGIKPLQYAHNVFNAQTRNFDDVLNVIPVSAESEVCDIIVSYPHVYITANFYTHESCSVYKKQTN